MQINLDCSNWVKYFQLFVSTNLKKNFCTLSETLLSNKKRHGPTLKSISIQKWTFSKQDKNYWTFLTNYIQINTLITCFILFYQQITCLYQHSKITLPCLKNYFLELLRLRCKLHSMSLYFPTKMKKINW